MAQLLLFPDTILLFLPAYKGVNVKDIVKPSDFQILFNVFELFIDDIKLNQ